MESDPKCAPQTDIDNEEMIISISICCFLQKNGFMGRSFLTLMASGPGGFGLYTEKKEPLLIHTPLLANNSVLLQTEMMTRAELAFSALDKDNSGYISTRELRKLSAKLSEEEIRALMVKVSLT